MDGIYLSPYSKKIRINRHVTRNELYRIMKMLETGNLLTLPESTTEQFEGPEGYPNKERVGPLDSGIRLIFSCNGYLDEKTSSRKLKLTNDERRRFIQEVKIGKSNQITF